jgi:protein SCO1
MRMRRLARCLPALFLLIAQALGSAEGAEFRGGLLSPPRAAPDFTLPTADGREFRLSAQRGSVVALSFGYTSCPDVCPTTLAELVQVRSRLGESGKRLRIVFITVDPERDTPARLAEYARAFSGGFTALGGAVDALARVRKAYGVVAEKRAIKGTGAGHLIDHSAFVYVVDRNGGLRLMLPFGTPLDDMIHDFELLLRE